MQFIFDTIVYSYISFRSSDFSSIIVSSKALKNGTFPYAAKGLSSIFLFFLDSTNMYCGYF